MFQHIEKIKKSLEAFYSRLQELGSQCSLGELQEDIVKDVFSEKT